MDQTDVNDLHFILGELYVSHRRALDKIDKLEKQVEGLLRLNVTLEERIVELQGGGNA